MVMPLHLIIGFRAEIKPMKNICAGKLLTTHKKKFESGQFLLQELQIQENK
jgi:hypothetical protein